MAAGLWAATVIPGVDTGGGPFWRQVAAVLGATVISGALWGLAISAARLFRTVTGWFGRHVEITFTGALAFPALTSSIPGSGTVADLDLELAEPTATALGRALLLVLRPLLGLAILVLQFWSTGWVATRVGLGFEVDGIWPAVGGCAVANLVYASVLLLVALPRITQARAAADRRYQEAQEAGLGTEAARAEARKEYDRVMHASALAGPHDRRGSPS